MHIKSFALRSLRKLNLNHDLARSDFKILDIDGLQAATVNIVVGPNGGGKSTVVDLVRAMGNANLLPTLARENINAGTSCGFLVRFDNSAYVVAQFGAASINEFGLAIAAVPAATPRGFEGKIKKHSNVPVPKDLSDVIDCLSAKVEYRERHDEGDVPVQAFIDALNADGKHLSGLAPFPLAPDQNAYENPSESAAYPYNSKSPVRPLEDGIVSVSFNDDQLQHNHVPIAMFPSGWKAFGGLVAWLATRDEGAICVIEEPETHIHPKLLRILMRRISELASARNLQVFMTTHSSTLIDIHTWPIENVKLFEANGYQIRELTSPTLALANLGVRPSDVCQANGVIWVEGSSDRLYLLHWLKLWCAQNGKEMPVENIHFSFALYGGAMLNQFVAKPSGDLIEIFKINQNSLVVMDRDLDFITDADGNEIPKNPAGAKATIYKDIDSAGVGRYCWITQRYTMESYLPSEFRNEYYELKDDRLRPTSSVSKVAVAERFRSEFNSFATSYEHGSDLPVWIERICHSIDWWNV
ncbi:hypothetical protein GALL_144290 [mine drainage metagenome]|uniref:ATPase AAA-type core domain-containing protein n=1 Tax=mine drainage metagenome TaxID=410659 RepID=A0A1J5S621_9ZZZZ